MSNVFIMKLQFPMLNISLVSLNPQSLEEIHIGDLWDYPRDNHLFDKYYLNQQYVDQNGHIFKITGKTKTDLIHAIIHFNKDKLKFDDTGRNIKFNDLKNFVIQRYATLDDDFAKSILIDLATKSRSFKELIG